MLFFVTASSFNTFMGLEDVNTKTWIAGLYTSIAVMLLHGLVDFDMSLMGYALVFWTILGAHLSDLNFTSLDKYFKRFYMQKALANVLVIIAIGLAINTTLIAYSKRYATRAVEERELSINEIVDNLEKASKMDRLKPEYYLDLANLYKEKFESTNESAYLTKAAKRAEKYVRLTSYDASSQALASSFNMSIGDVDRGIELLEKAVELEPLIVENYIYKCDGYLAVIDYYYNKGEYENAREMLKKALTVKEQIKGVNERASKPMTRSNELVEKIGYIEALYRNFDNLNILAQKGLAIQFAYYFDMDINYDGELDMLTASIPKDSLIKHEVLAEEGDSFIRITNEGEAPGFKYVTPLTFEPNTTHVVELKARGTAKPETFSLYAWSRDSENANQGELKYIDLTDEWQSYRFQFTADSDLEPGNQYIRIQHNGKETGHIDVKDLVIYVE